jgi:PPM family protein phosphatase
MVRPFPVPSHGQDEHRNRCRHAGMSDPGRRPKNQDRWFADDHRQIYLVADGMGGRPAGELVAEMIVQQLPPRLDKALGDRADLQRPAVIQVVMAEVSSLSRQIWEHAQTQPGLVGMGATLVLAVVRQRRALVIHLGDSRVYHIRDSQVTRLTRDHNLLQQLLDAGRISPDKAKGHILSTQLTRYAGMDDLAVPDAHLLDFQPGDRLLLCTDGLSGMVDHDRLAAIATAPADLSTTCQTLVREANAAGGYDNITVILVEMCG